MSERDTPPRKILVVGLGNSDRGDDGVGAVIAERLAHRLPADVTLRARRGDMLSLITDWAGFDALICVDAAAPMSAPGRIHRIDLGREELPRDIAFMSSHDFGLAEAIALARTLGTAPRDIVVYAVEGGSFETGVPMTQAVAAAVEPVAHRVLAEIGRLRALPIEAACDP